jgi:hypothetical protein
LFPVEIQLLDCTGETLTRRITAIPQWLDKAGFEPSTFRYTFLDVGMVLRVDFNLELEAVAFAREFSGIGAYLAREVPTTRLDETANVLGVVQRREPRSASAL